MEEEYHSDYPTVPTDDPGNPYYECAHCGRTDPEINGRIEGHAEWCEYRLKKDNILNNSLKLIPVKDRKHSTLFGPVLL